jgi:hypothetical protein
MSKLTKALTAAAGNAGEALYVEDVFSTYLYDGNSSNRDIVNNIDLAGEGGLTWIKARDVGYSHQLFDTERGATKQLYTNVTSAETTAATSLTSFNSNGFSLGTLNGVNNASQTFASWSFRKAEKFFDVVTYSSDTTSGARTISHNLGSTPAFIIVKGLNFSDAWYVYHIGTGVNKYLELNLTGAGHAFTNFWGVTDSTFTVDSFLNNNGSTGKDYVAYLFASDAGGFGDDGSENIIKCGSFDGAANTEVNLGFEPQWIMFKNTTNASNWQIVDSMRGMPVGSDDRQLMANLSNAESDNGLTTITATGFTWLPSAASNTYIYIAIRRPMKTPESGTEVFNPTTAAVGTDITNNFPADLWFGNNTSGDGGNNAHTFASRLTGLKWLQTATAAAESTASNTFYWDSNTTFTNSQFGGDRVGYYLKRATGFFDVVAYTGTGVAHSETHNLGVVPELMIVKSRSNAFGWHAYASALGNTKAIRVDQNGSEITSSLFWNNTSPTSTNFTVGTFSNINSNGSTFIAYLFATLDGISKVGSYTGTGNNLNVDCGFSSGARFVLVKRTDSTGDWYVWDSVRGIVAGNDPYLLLNSNAAQVTNTDYIDPLSSGFTVTSTAPAALNASGGTYIFLAIA